MKAVLREPLLHFALLGAALFFVYGWIGEEAPAPTEIVISAKTIEGLALSFQRVWDRPPTQAELDELIAEQTKEEIYYREGVAAGLDRDDSIIRRRLRQKMEFLTEDLAAQAEPTDAELQKFVDQHADRYRTPDASGELPPLAEIRERAVRHWLAERKQRATDALYEKLRKGYTVRIERDTDGA